MTRISFPNTIIPKPNQAPIEYKNLGEDPQGYFATDYLKGAEEVHGADGAVRYADAAMEALGLKPLAV